MNNTPADTVEVLDDENRSKLATLKSIVQQQQTLIHDKKAAALRDAEVSVRQRADNQRALREEIAKYESYIHKHQQKQPKTREQVRQLEQQVEEYRTQYQNSQAKKRSIQQTRDHKEAQTIKARKQLEKAELLANTEALQLKITGLGDFKNKFEFRCIDENHPEKEYSFVLRLSEDGIYSVTACDPPIRNLDELEAQLRQEGDPYLFLKRMRNAFSEHAASNGDADTMKLLL
ncbi:chromosome segregation protein Spc25-domain-containing protein [Zychaea mexicana]|uniref:chromosome segregation protein Spc25-domain-containing protein n=1 Tax=Zychaea mexicana TaxID=64656 RepID=UPI0022FEDC3A|nr:chromosome segregation protein Spc25-domain-containing protein [Zychaea mexicana]KAI9496465.1 chromosome segregation protein Spc25-domain-containing protein [Zychaea mexicana]